jgi:hypothetical protein
LRSPLEDCEPAGSPTELAKRPLMGNSTERI